MYWCFSFWLTSLCIIGSSFTHLIECIFFKSMIQSVSSTKDALSYEKDTGRRKVKRWKKLYLKGINTEEGYFTMIEGSVSHKDVTSLSVCAANNIA